MCLCVPPFALCLSNIDTLFSYGHLYEGSMNTLLVVIQAIVAVICVDICRKMGWCYMVFFADKY